MAENPLRNPNRENQIKREQTEPMQSITLYDVDAAIMGYLSDVILPKIDDNGQSVKIPVVYGNSERWEGARRNGHYRDLKGKIQLPIFMIRRSGVAKNDGIPMLNRHVTYQAINKYSKDNRYSRFNILTGAQPKYEIYSVTMPDYVEVTYECMGWAAYTEQVNKIVESLNWASDEYWGDKTKFKFMSTISDYNVINELDEGNQRINRVECTINVKAYLLPEKFDGEQTTKKSYGIKRVILTTEVDLTANGRMETSLVNPIQYNSNKDIVDYLAINSTEIATYSGGEVLFTNIKPIRPPKGLSQVISGGMSIDGIDYDIKVYKNSTLISSYSVIYSNETLIISAMAGVSNGDQITLVGKFINV